MFGDVGQARTKAAMLLLPIATTLSRTCTKPTVACWFTPVAPKRNFHSQSKVFRRHLLGQHEHICRRSTGKTFRYLALALTLQFNHLGRCSKP